MQRVSLFLNSLVIFIILLLFTGNTKAFSFETVADSLRAEISKKSGDQKISAELDLAMELYERENAEAWQIGQSALKKAKKSAEKELLMRAFYVLGRISQQTENSQLSQSYYDSASVISKSLNDKFFQSQILLNKGISQHVQGDFLNALLTFNQAISIGTESENYRIVGGAYSMMGTIYRENGLYDRAIDNILKSRLYYAKASFAEGYAWDAYLLGRIYADLQLPEDALEYFQTALHDYKDMAQQDDNQIGVAICLEQIALVSIQLKKFDLALESNNQARQIYGDSNSSYGLSNTEIIQGRIEYGQENYKKAESVLVSALEKKLEMDDKLNQPNIYEYLGLSQIKLGKTKEGLKNLHTALELAIDIDQKKNQIDIYSKLAEIYETLKQSDKVVLYQKKLIEVQNELLTGGTSLKKEQLQNIYDAEVRNTQIVELQRQNEINELKIKEHRITNLFLISGILMALLIVLFTFQYYRRLKENNQKLYEANAAKDRLFTIIAHDLRGPVNTLTAFIELLHSGFDQMQKENLKSNLQILYKSSQNVSKLLENLLLWSGTQTKGINYSPKRLNLKTEVEKVFDGLEQTALEKEIVFSSETSSGIDIWADENMIQVIFRNILSNALKFTKRGGKVGLKAEISGKFAVIRITDKGTGMNPEELAGIFEIDNKLRKPGTENEMSTGLGLLLVKDFVEKNRGSVKIESQVGKGTTVIVSLPLASLS